MSKEYAESLGKSVKSGVSLSSCWFYGFLGRWPDLTIRKPQKLASSRAEGASREKLDRYFRELATFLTSNGLRERPERIYNIDETGVNPQHNPLNIVCNNKNLNLKL